MHGDRTASVDVLEREHTEQEVGFAGAEGLDLTMGGGVDVRGGVSE